MEKSKPMARESTTNLPASHQSIRSQGHLHQGGERDLDGAQETSRLFPHQLASFSCIGIPASTSVDVARMTSGYRPRIANAELRARRALAVDPVLWNQVRRAVDAVNPPGQFLLTCSAVPTDDAERHIGAGRFSFLRLRPMTLRESGVSQGGVSMAALPEGQSHSCADPGLAVADLAELERPLAAASRAAHNDPEQVRQVDVQRVDGRRRDPQRLAAQLRSLGRNVATEVSLATLAADAGGGAGAQSRRSWARWRPLPQACCAFASRSILAALENPPSWR